MIGFFKKFFRNPIKLPAKKKFDKLIDYSRLLYTFRCNG